MSQRTTPIYISQVQILKLSRGPPSKNKIKGSLYVLFFFLSLIKLSFELGRRVIAMLKEKYF
jgi:hypothetical protein